MIEILEISLIVFLAIIAFPIIFLVLGFVTFFFSWMMVLVISEGFVKWAKFVVDVVDSLKKLWEK